MKLSEIHIRDPFIMLVGDRYYMYGTRGPEAWGDCGSGFDVYVSEDLETWSEPIAAFTPAADFWADRNFWAPEVHEYRGRYYMFASFKSATRERGTQILVSDAPEGPFVPHSDGPVTPAEWSCLDGTLYVEDGRPYMVFCHEWSQIRDGEMCAMPLTDDLRAPAGEPVVLFHASEPAWAIGMGGQPDYVTDGPFMYRTAGGSLLMIWSSLTGRNYCEAIARSASGAIAGPWTHGDSMLFDRDGGHGMIFRTREGQLKFVLHQPNRSPDERPRILDLTERDDTLWAE